MLSCMVCQFDYFCLLMKIARFHPSYSPPCETRPMAVVYGKPSALMSKEISDEEKEREARQVEDVGEEGLLSLQTTLEEAMSKNEQPIPEETLTSLPVPDIEKVSSVPLFTAHLSPSANSLELTVVHDSILCV